MSQLTKLVTQGFDQSPAQLIACINLTHNKYGFFTNLIVKLSVTSQLFALANQYTSNAAEQLAKVNLLMLQAVAKPILQIKNRPALLTKYRPHLRQAARIAFKKTDKQAFQDQDTLRLLSQLAGLNKYAATNQNAQNICKLAINTTFFCQPIHSQTKLSLKVALDRILAGSTNVFPPCEDPNLALRTKQWLEPLLQSGNLVRLANQHFGILLSKATAGKEQWCLFEFNQNKLDTNAQFKIVKETDIRLVMPQQSMDLFVLLRLFSGNIEQISSAVPKPLLQPLGRHGVDLVACNEMVATAEVLQTEHQQRIREYLSNQYEACQRVLDHASRVNRQQQKVTDLKHALALIGVLRLYPVIADSKLISLQQEQIKLGLLEVLNKSDRYANIMFSLAVNTELEIPEYAMFLGRVMFQSLITIPKAGYAAASPAHPAIHQASSLSGAFAPTVHKQWRQVCVKMSQNWCLPKAYLASLKNYFDLIDNKVQLQALPRSSQRIVAVLHLGTIMFLHIAAGQRQLRPSSQLAPCSQVLGFTAKELQQVYLSLLGELAPATRLD